MQYIADTKHNRYKGLNMNTTVKQADKLAIAFYEAALAQGFTEEKAQMLLNQVWDVMVHGKPQAEELPSQFY